MGIQSLDVVEPVAVVVKSIEETPAPNLVALPVPLLLKVQELVAVALFIKRPVEDVVKAHSLLPTPNPVLLPVAVLVKTIEEVPTP